MFLDKVGLLATLSTNLANRNLSIENISTELRVGKNGRRDFVVNCDCVTNDIMTQGKRDVIVRELRGLRTEMSLDILDIRILKFS